MFIAYIYDLDNNVFAQVEDILDLNIQDKINDISKASFGLYQSNPYCTRTYLKEYRRVKICLNENWEEKTMFDGVIRWFDADLDKTSIKLESYDHLFERRLLHVDYNYTDQSVDTILQDILDDINILYETNIILDCGISTLTSKSYKKAENFLKVLKDLAWNWYEFIIEDLVLKFKETIWIDRTTGAEFVEYRYDINDPDDRSIDQVKMANDWKELANGVIWKSWSDYTEDDDATSITEFWLVESSFTTSWDDTTSTASFLLDHKESLSEFDVWAVTNDFFEAFLWDLVKVYIFVWNDIMFFDWPMKIIEKQYIWWDLPKIKYTLSKTKIQSKGILEQVVDIQERLKTLELI